MHLAPTASKRIYQQRVGRVTRRQPGKEAGIVVDFVHPATKHDDPVVTLHSLLDRDVYRGGAIVVGPVRRGRGRRLRVERRVVPVTADENRRIEVFERELWRIAVEHLDYGEQVQWAALAGARVAPNGWRRARAMLHFDQGGELKRTFLITAVQRNKNPQLRLRALQEIAASRDAEAFDLAIEMVGGWPRDEKREGVKIVLQALAEKKIGRRDQANNWIWACAEMTREVHEEYAVQRWPETKRLLGLLVNSSGGAHARNARRLVHAARQQDRRLSAALLAAAIPHTAEAGEVVNGARTRMSRKPAALARELLRNFPKGKSARRGSRRRKKKSGQEAETAVAVAALAGTPGGEAAEPGAEEAGAEAPRKSRRSRRRKAATAEPVVAASESSAREAGGDGAPGAGAEQPEPAPATAEAAAVAPEPASAGTEAPGAEPAAPGEEPATPAPQRRRRRAPKPEEAAVESPPADEAEAPKPRRRRAPKPEEVAAESPPAEAEEAPKRRRRAPKPEEAAAESPPAPEGEAPKPRRRRAAKPKDEGEAPKPSRRRAGEPTSGDAGPTTDAVAKEAKRTRRPRTTKKAVDDAEAATGNGASPLERASDRVRDTVLKHPASDEAA